MIHLLCVSNKGGRIAAETFGEKEMAQQWATAQFNFDPAAKIYRVRTDDQNQHQAKLLQVTNVQKREVVDSVTFAPEQA